MEKIITLIKKIIVILFNPLSPVVTLVVGWILTIIITPENSKLPKVINSMIKNPLSMIFFLILWLVFSIIYTELNDENIQLNKEILKRDEIIKEKEAQLNQTSAIILNRVGDFAYFSKLLKFNDVLNAFVENNTLVESAQIYRYSIKREGKNIVIKVIYEAGMASENVDTNNLAQTYYDIQYKDYNEIKDIIKTWKKLSLNDVNSTREKDALINLAVGEITSLYKRYYGDLQAVKSVDDIEGRHFTEYRIITLLTRLARRSKITTFDKQNILGVNKVEIENYLLNGKRTGILGCIILEDLFMFKYTRNSHKKNGRAYVSFPANIYGQNYSIVFSVQMEELDPYTDLENEIRHLKDDFIARLNQK